MERPQNLGPYRASARPAATPPFKTSRLMAAIGLSVVCVVGLLSLLRRAGADPLAASAVPALIDFITTFPPPQDELPIATPLAPLLAADAPESLAVLSPAEEGAIRLRRGDVLTVRFNRPMVRATQVGRALAESPIVLTPTVAGTARWVSRSSVTFTPDPRAYDRPRESSVTFDADLASVDGEILYDETPRVIVLDGTPRLLSHESTAPVGAPILLTFDAPVRTAELARELFAFEQGGGFRTLPVRVVSRGLVPTSHEGQERYLVALEPTRALEPGARIGISVAPRWMSWGGAYAGSLAVQLEPRPRIEGIGCTISDWGTAGCAFRGEPGEIVDIESELILLSTHALGDVDASSVRVTPAASGLEVEVAGEGEEARRHLVVRAEWDPDQVYEIRLARLFTARGAPLVQTGPMAVRSAGHLPTLRAQTGSFVFERDAEIRWPFVGVHLDEGQLRRRVVRPGDEVRALLHPAAYVTEARGEADASTRPLAPFAPGVRPNRWARGEVQVAHEGSVMEVVALQAGARGEPTDLHASLVIATDLGVSATAVDAGVVVWVTSIATGAPIAGARVSLFSAAGAALAEVRTGDDGAVSVLTDAQAAGSIDHAPLEAPTVIVVATDHDRTVMTLDPRSAIGAATLGVSGGSASGDGEVHATVISDRGAYRPEETVRALAIVRRVEGTSLTTPPRTTVAMRLMGPSSELPVASLDVPLSPAGVASATFALPDGAGLGEYRVEAVLDTRVIGTRAIQLSEYREPRFRLDLTAPPERSLVEGDALSIGIAARYLFGASVAGASARYSVVRGGAVGHGTRWRELTFAPVDGHAARATLAEGDLALDAHGEGRIETHVALGVPTRTSLEVEVEVTDESGESTASHRTIVARPADVEVGLRRGQGFVALGQPLTLEAIVLDAADAPIIGQAIEARIVRVGNQGYYEWEDASRGALDADGSFQLRRAQARDEVHHCALRSAEELARCEWTPDRAGGYLLEVESRDPRGRSSVASRLVYVAGPEGAPDRDPAGAPIAVTPGRDHYRVGDEAEIAFESPFSEAEVMVIVSTDRVLSRQHLHVGPGGTTVRIPLTDRMAPNAFVTLALVRPRTGPPGGRIDLDAPDLRVGATELRVDPALSPLTVAIDAHAATARPGAQVPIEVHVTGDGGDASGVEVALWAVDEGTLRLTSWQVPDPTEGLFVRRAARFAIEDLRRSLVSRLPGALDPGPSGDGGYIDAPMQLQSRERYEPTPLFVTTLVTDASGRATATLDVPDRLTEYRLVAVAVDRAQRFGRVESSLVVTQPVIVRPALPRFLGEGDEVELAAFVHDESSVAIDAEVTIAAFGETHTLGTVHVEPGTDVRVVQRVTVPALSAPTDIEIGVRATVNGQVAEHHVTRTLDVMPRARWVRRRALTLGVTGERDLPIAFPAGTSSRGAMRAITGTHPFIALDGVADDLAESWWSGGEIDAAVVLGLASHARLSGGLSVPGRDTRERAQLVQTRLRALERLGDVGGGWMAERSAGDADGRTTVAALRARLAAHAAGMLDDAARARTVRGADALALLVQRGSIGTSYGYGASNRDLLALALHTLSEIEHRDDAVITREFEGREFLSPYALAHLALAMENSDRRREALVTLALTRFTAPPGGAEGQARFASADTQTLSALVVAAAETAAGRRSLPDLTGLLLERCSDGRASLADPFSTADAIDALARVADRFAVEGTSAPVLTLDGAPLDARATSDTVALYDVPFASLASGDHQLLVRGTADRPVYLALDARWAEPLGPADDDARGRAASLHRVFETPAGSPIPTGSHVALGALVRVRLFLHTESTTPEWTAVRDPHAAGLEPVDGGLDTSASAEIAALVGMSPDDDVFDVRAIRAMNTLGYVRSHAHTPNASTFQLRALGPGLYELTYALRAATPGTFTVGPASIEALRDPDFVARSESATFTVDP